MRQAARIAINRTVAGVHYPVDSLAGQLLGMTVAEYALARFKPAGTTTLVDAWVFDGSQVAALQNEDFTGSELFNPITDVRRQNAYADKLLDGGGAVQASVQGSANLNWLWQQASAEW